MTPSEIKLIRTRLHRTQAGLAKVLGTTYVTIARWEAGVSAPLPVFIEKLEKLSAYAERLEKEER